MTGVRNVNELEKEINRRAGLAVKAVADIMCERLKECINEQYYEDPEFYPNVYDRTEAFLNSAVMSMLNPNCAEIGIDETTMHYKNGFSSRQVVEWAAQSMHGAPMYHTGTEPFWDVFDRWCSKNVIELLKTELRKHGIGITR